MKKIILFIGTCIFLINSSLAQPTQKERDSINIYGK